jgi:hypothetical protein
VPPGCTKRTHADAIAVFDCGPSGGPREGALVIFINKKNQMSASSIQGACKDRAELRRATAEYLSGTMFVREARCDLERHEMVLTGTYRAPQELREAELLLIPTSEGMLVSGALWHHGTAPATIAALRRASQSAEVPEKYRIWPGDDEGTELASSTKPSSGPRARPSANGPDPSTPVALLFFGLGVVGAITLFRIVKSEDLGARVRRDG